MTTPHRFRYNPKLASYPLTNVTDLLGLHLSGSSQYQAAGQTASAAWPAQVYEGSCTSSCNTNPWPAASEAHSLDYRRAKLGKSPKMVLEVLKIGRGAWSRFDMIPRLGFFSRVSF